MPTTVREQPAEEQRDLLDDVARVLRGLDRLKVTDAAAQLRELAPGWAPYATLSGEELAVQLDTAGVPVRKLKGTLTVRSGNVLAALADRDETDADNDGDDVVGLDDEGMEHPG